MEQVNNSPSLISPWYVLVRDTGSYSMYLMEGDVWLPRKQAAVIFTSLRGAKRIAESEKADILVIWDKEKLKEFKNEQ